MENFVRPSKDEYYLDIALAVSRRSTCLRRHYGVVIVKDDIIIATGYNGSPRGEENCCDRGTCYREGMVHNSGDYSECCSVHAEQNALIAASRDRLIGATVYIACEGRSDVAYAKDVDCNYSYCWVEYDNPVPCPICERMLKNAGVSRVVNRKGDCYVRN